VSAVINGAAPFLGGVGRRERRRGIGYQALGDDGVIVALEGAAPLRLPAQGIGRGGLHGGFGLQQQILHVLGLSLGILFMDIGQLPERVGVAQGMRWGYESQVLH
jgi:hypothetical protein